MLGRAILKLRHEKGLTQADLGSRAGLAATFVSRVENERIEPSLASLARLARALDVRVADLFNAVEGLHEPPCHVCPVSSTGECVGSLFAPARGREAEGDKAIYRPADLSILRLADHVVRRGSKETIAALRTVLEALADAAGRDLDDDPLVTSPNSPTSSP